MITSQVSVVTIKIAQVSDLKGITSAIYLHAQPTPHITDRNSHKNTEISHGKIEFDEPKNGAVLLLRIS